MGDISTGHADRLKVADYVAFDLETTGLSPETDEILEVALVRFHGGIPVDRWSSLVNPGIPVPLKTFRLTRIDPGELTSSPALGDILDRIQDFRRDLPLVGHNSGFDSSFLAKRIPGFPGVPLYDTLELSRIVVPGFSSYKLVDLAQAMGVIVSEAHRAYDDAEVSGTIFKLLQLAALEMSQGNRDVVRYLLGKGWVAAPMFEPGGVDRATSAQPSLFDVPPRPWRATTAAVAIAAPRVGLSGVPAPSPMREALLGALETGPRAGALNVPMSAEAAQEVTRAAADYALGRNARVLLVGFPKESLPGWALRVGSPADYACLARLEESARLAEMGKYVDTDLEQRRFLAALYRWTEATSSGCLGEVQWGNAGYEVAPEIACPPGLACECSCPVSQRCFYVAARARFAGSTGGLLAYSASGASLPDRERFDEALVWNAWDLGRAWQAGEVRTDLQSLREVLKAAGTLASVLSLDGLISSAAADLARGGMASTGTVGLASRASREIEAASKAIRIARGGAEPGGYPVDPPLVWRDLHILEQEARVLGSFSMPPDAATAQVVEQSMGDAGRKGPVLSRRAVWPAKAAVDALSRSSGRVLLLSDVVSTASTSVGGRRLLGLDDDPAACSHVGAAEASGAGQVLLATLDAGKMVSPQEYASYLAGFIVPLALQVRKGLLVVFPSRALLRDTYTLVQPDLEREGVAVYGHGVDGGRRVVDHLVDEDSIVFAMVGNGPTPGEPVPECLVLTRVPFAPPNALDEIRRGQAQSPAGDFVEVGVRPASLAIRSYVEKMKRAGGARSVVLADPKVLPRKSSWGAEFMSAFADLPRFTGPDLEILARLKAAL